MMLLQLFNKKNIIFTAILVLFNSCIFLKPVEIKNIEKIHIVKLSVTSAKLNLHLIIDNPNIVKITIADIDLDVLIENERIGTIQEIDEIEIQAKSGENVIVKLNVSFSNVFSKALRIVKLLSKPDVKIKLKGTITTKSFLFTKTINIDEEDIVSLFKN